MDSSTDNLKVLLKLQGCHYLTILLLQEEPRLQKELSFVL